MHVVDAIMMVVRSIPFSRARTLDTTRRASLVSVVMTSTFTWLGYRVCNAETACKPFKLFLDVILCVCPS